jgi:hypothetical protein
LVGTGKEGKEGKGGKGGKGGKVSTKHRIFGSFSEALKLSSASRPEGVLLLSAWLMYLIYNIGGFGNSETWMSSRS